MTAAISTFIAGFTGGGARPNRFMVSFDTAPVSFPNSQIIECKSATIPASNMGVIPLKYMGRTIKVPGDKQFDDWTVTFLNDTNFKLRHTFERWSNLILGHKSNIDQLITKDSPEGVLSNYFGNATVTHLDRSDKPIAIYKLSKIWPTLVSEIQLSFDNDDQVEEFSVTFAVNEWFVDTSVDNSGVQDPTDPPNT